MPNKMLRKKLAYDKRKKRIKKKVKGTSERPRLAVHRSLNNIYAQIIDDFTGQTLLSASTLTKDLATEISNAKGKCAKSKVVGKWLAETAKKKEISKIVFDRGGYLFHGRIKALADGAREGGLEF